MKLRLFPLALATALLGAGPGLYAAAGPPDRDPAFHRLDFWLGDWEVVEAKTGAKAGTNHIEKILRGCAVLENWTEADGSGEGKSLFYYNPATGAWKQVWVTDAGFAKEKQLVPADLPAGAVRFQGEVALPGSGTVLDRTTLTPLADGRVRQLIEISRDRGATWQTNFDAYYAHPKSAAHAPG